MSSWASELKSDERVVFFPAFAWTGQDTWNLQVHGWVFEPGEHKFYGALLRRALGIKPSELTAEEHAIYSQRAQYFLHDSERRKVLTISLDGKPYAVGPSSPNGHFTAQLPVPSEWIQKVRTSRLTNDFTGFEMVAHGQTGPAPFGTIQVFSDTGLSVISDIDDTIKISQVLERKELLKNTFARPFKPVPGMAAVYQSWRASAGADFHYISAMPWQLYTPIAEFMRSNSFPAGTFSGRYFRIKDMSFLQLFRSPEKYKTASIEEWFIRFPKRRFVLVGDSGEKDPEIYGALARRFPQLVQRIFIRDITNELPASTRYRNAFKDVPRDKWILFKDPKEIEHRLTEVKL